MKILEIIPALSQHRLFLGVDLQDADAYWNEQTMSLSDFEDGEVAYSSECERVRVGILLEGCAQIFKSVGEEFFDEACCEKPPCHFVNSLLDFLLESLFRLNTCGVNKYNLVNFKRKLS